MNLNHKSSFSRKSFSFLIFFIFLFLVIIEPVFGQNFSDIEDDLTELKNDLQIQNQKIDSTLDILTQTNKDIQNLTTTVGSLAQDISDHQSGSWGVFYFSITLGAIIGAVGWVLGIAQLIPGRTKRKEDTEKKNKAENFLKDLLGNIFDFATALEKVSPDKSILKTRAAWNETQLRIEVINTIIQSYASFLEPNFVHKIIGFCSFMKDQFESANDEQLVPYKLIVRHTKNLIDKFFPNYFVEKRAYEKFLEEQSQEMSEQLEKEALEWYEKQLASGYFDEENET